MADRRRSMPSASSRSRIERLEPRAVLAAVRDGAMSSTRAARSNDARRGPSRTVHVPLSCCTGDSIRRPGSGPEPHGSGPTGHPVCAHGYRRASRRRRFAISGSRAPPTSKAGSRRGNQPGCRSRSGRADFGPRQVAHQAAAHRCSFHERPAHPHDTPYGTERSYNGLRLALALAKVEGTTVRVFLMADAIACAKPGQTTPDGYYNIGRMLKGLTAKGVEVGTCGSWMDVRGFTDADLAEGICRSSMEQLAEWTLAADKVVTF